MPFMFVSIILDWHKESCLFYPDVFVAIDIKLINLELLHLGVSERLAINKTQWTMLVAVIVGIFLDLFVVSIQSIRVRYNILLY